MMDGWVGKDYEIGLGLLAMHAGDNSNPFQLEFPGIADVPAEDYIALHYEGSAKKIPEVMKDGFPKLMKSVQDNGLEISGMPFAQYHAFNAIKDFVSCDMVIPVKSPKPLKGYVVGSHPACKCLRTVVRGDYSNLELAWHSAIGHLRMVKSKPVKGAAMMERYISNPHDCKGLDLVTHIDMPIVVGRWSLWDEWQLVIIAHRFVNPFTISVLPGR